MKRLASLAFALIMILILAGWTGAQSVNVDIPDMSAETTVSIPINVSSLTGLGIISYQLIVTFDENVLDATGVTTTGTLSQDAGYAVYPNTSADGQITVGGFGVTEMSGSGVLVYLDFNVVGDPSETTNLDFLDFFFNDRNPATNTSGGTFTVTGTLINITVTTSVGTGTKVIVDGTEQDAPYSTQWYATTSHTISVASEQSGGAGTKYLYNSWAHGGSQTQTVAPTTATTYTTNLDTKYYLTVNSAQDSPQGEGWYNANATANFSVTTPADEAGGTRYRFTQWSGDKTTNNPSESITMNAPKAVTANWQVQYFLSTAENPSNGGDITPAPSGAWYDGGSNVQVSASPAANYEFTNWSGALSGSNNPDQVSMTLAKSVTANFTKLVQITVDTSPSGREFIVDGNTYTSTQVFTWAEGSQHALSVNSPQNGATGTRYNYSSWSNGGNQSHTYTTPGTNQTLTANFSTQHYLTVTSSRDNPQGEGWYNAGVSANFSVTSPADESNGIRYVFDEWTGDYSGSNTSGSVIMSAAKEVIAGWTTQYFLTVNSAQDSPQGQGWYNSGASASFSVTTPADEAGGTRYRFTQWSGDHSGTNPSSSITMNAAKNVTANWQTQYFLTTSENPSAGGDITPSPPGTWYDSGTNAQVNATEEIGYQWAGWSGNLSGTTRPDNILMNGPKSVTANFGKQVQITIQTSPSGRTFTVDGNVYNSTQVFTWVENSQHTLSVTSPQSGGVGMEYVYSSWSDGGNQSHTYDTPGANETITANFTTRYFLTVTSTRDSPQGQGWYNAGSSANFSITSPADESNGTRYVFDQWTGDYSGSNTSGSVTMNAAKEVIAGWTTQYYLTVNSSRDSPQGAAWYNSGVNANFSVTTPADEAGGIRYRFTQWSGDHTGTNPSANITMNDAKAVTANWQTQYYLTTSENPPAGGDITPSPTGGWYDSGANAQVDATVAPGYQWAGWSGNLSGATRPDNILMNGPKSVTANFGKLVQITIQTSPSGRTFTVDGNVYNSTQVFTWVENSQHTLSVSSPQNGATGTRYSYSSWSDGGNQSHSYTTPGTDQTVTANFSTQHYLTVTSSRDNPLGEGWYNAGVSANFSVTSPADESNGTRYVFDQWTGDYSGSNTSGSVTMSAAKEVIAGWTTQYYLMVTSSRDSPQGAGWYNSGVIANFSVTTPADEAGGIRYRFTQWSGDHSGSNPSANITMNGAKAVTANWQTQYYLTTSENPPAGGDITPSPTGDWYDSGTSAQVNATVAPGYQWGSWSGDLSGTTRPDYVLMNAAKSVTANFDKLVDITVQTIPAGRTFTVDGNSYSSPQTFTWVEGSQHTLALASPQSGGAGIEYVYSSWSDGGGQSHNFTAPGSNQTVTANFLARYYLTVTSTHDNPQGEGWYNAGVSANFSVTSPADESNGTRYVFTQWSGDYNGSNTSGSIVMNSPKEVIAGWAAQYYLTVTSSYDSPQGAGWYNSGATANFSVTSPADESNGTRYAFTQWSGAFSGTNTSGNVTMNSPKTVTANWQTQYFLTTAENPAYGGNVDPAPPGDWYNSGTAASVTATPSANYSWTGWTGHLSGAQNPAQITMNAPKSVTANFAGETVSTPDTPNGPSSGITGQSLTYTASGASSSFGHAIEYKFDWGDGSESGWVSASGTHAYSSKGNYIAKARARCKSHTEVISSWSNARTVNIDSYSLSTSVSPAGAGGINKNPNKSGYDYNEVVRLTANGSTGSKKFDRWEGSLTGTQNPKDLTMNGNKSVTAFFITETVSTPDEPVGPAQAYAGQNIDFEVDGSQSSFGHAVEYQLDFGDGNQSNWGASPINYVYSNTGINNVTARARCADHNEIMSDLSVEFTITITGLTLTVFVNPDSAGSVSIDPEKSEYNYLEIVQLDASPFDGSAIFDHWTGVGSDSSHNPAGIIMRRNREITANFIVETVSKPNFITGPTEGSTDQILEFQTSGAVSSFGHDVEYQFDGGDGTLSGWGNGFLSHSYVTFGAKQVRARARCSDHNQIVSEWSDIHNVVISDFVLNVTIDPLGKGRVTKNPDKLKYAENEAVELAAEAEPFYSFDHWSGDLTGNGNPATVIMNTNKDITAHFVKSSEIVTKPTFLGGPNSGIMGQSLQFSTGGSVSNLGNDVEYQFGWGDDTFSEWGDSTRSHNFFTSGELQVKSRARSKENLSIISPWTEAKIVAITGRKLMVTIDPAGSGNVEINPDQNNYIDSSIVQVTAIPDSGNTFVKWSGDVVGKDNPAILMMSKDKNVTAHFEEMIETVSNPDNPVGLKNGIIGQNINFTVGGSVNSLGLEVEYQFNWGDNSLSLWNSGEGSHTYFISDTFQVKARARSKINQQVISEWSDVHAIVIVGLSLSVTIEPVGKGMIAQNPNKFEYAYLDTVEMWPVGVSGYSFDHWSSDLLGDNSPARLIMNSNKNVIAHFVAVAEVISSPDKPQGPSSGLRKQELTYKAKGAVSNFGNNVEYQFDWGDGSSSSWGDSVRSHKFQTSGEFLIRNRARSKVNQIAVSNWSDTLSTRIEGCKLVITLDPENSGDVLKDPDQADYDYHSIVKLTAVNNPNFSFVRWDEDNSDTTKVKEILMDGDKEIKAWFESILSVNDIFVTIPTDFDLKQNYPNPFNPETTFEYQLAKDSEVQLTIYNIKGQEIIKLVNENQSAGNYSLIWNAMDQNGFRVPSGIYLYRISTKYFNRLRKMILLK